MRASGNVFPGACTLALLMSGFAAALEPALGPCIPPARDPAALSRDGIRAVVLDDSELDFALLEELKKLGVNTVVTGSRPNRMIAKHLDSAGLSTSLTSPPRTRSGSKPILKAWKRSLSSRASTPSRDFTT